MQTRKPGDWYVSQRVEVHYDAHPGILSSAYGNGATPAEAVEDHWRKLVTDLGPGDYIVLNALRGSRRHVQWNGAAWRDVGGNDRRHGTGRERDGALGDSQRGGGLRLTRGHRLVLPTY